MTRPFSIIATPIGPRCSVNFACCRHLGKARLYPGFRPGSIMPEGLAEIAARPGQAAFGATESAAPPARCRACRFARTTDGEGGLNHLRAGHRSFLHHAGPRLAAMARGLAAGLPPLPAPAAPGIGALHQGQLR